MLRSETASTGYRLVCERVLVGKWAIEAALSVQHTGFGENSRGTRNAKWAKQPSNGRGRDAMGRLSDLYSKKAETGLVAANAEAMGKDIEELGRTVLDGLQFEHDSATLMAESKPALEEIAKLLKSLGDKTFYVVGHTDSTGTYAYNMALSADRAMAVREALIEGYGIAPARLVSAGVGPLTPVFANSSEGGRSSNRRVELVER